MTKQIESTFSALAHPTRRAVIDKLCEGPNTVSKLARSFPISLPSFVQHLRIMERARLVESHKEGRVRTYRLRPAPLVEAENWLAAHREQWEQRLDRFEEYVERLHEGAESE